MYAVIGDIQEWILAKEILEVLPWWLMVEFIHRWWGGWRKECGQVGIVSKGFGCGDPRYPSMYTRVTSVLPWVRRVTGNATMWDSDCNRVYNGDYKESVQSSNTICNVALFYLRTVKLKSQFSSQMSRKLIAPNCWPTMPCVQRIKPQGTITGYGSLRVIVS